MKHYLLPVAAILVFLVTSAMPAKGGFFDGIGKGLGFSGSAGSGLDDTTIASGLKEALATGTANAVKSVSKSGGYFNNEMIKILLPENMRNIAELMSVFGFRQQVDDFVLSMNRAAEKAAPKAAGHFADAVKSMSFDDARGILNGGSTAATEYFRKKTGDKIFASFKPVVASSMKDVGVAGSYKQMIDRFETLPLVGKTESFDLDNYVTGKAVDGLFSMLGEEEKKIRTNPLARGSELLKTVFGR